MDMKERRPEAKRRPTASSVNAVLCRDPSAPSASVSKMEGTRRTRIPSSGDDGEGCEESLDEIRGRSVEGRSGWNRKTSKSSKCDDAGAVAVARSERGKVRLTSTSQRAEAYEEPDMDVSGRKEGGDGVGRSIRSRSARASPTASAAGAVDSCDDNDHAGTRSFGASSFAGPSFRSAPGNVNVPPSRPGAYSVVPGGGGSGRRSASTESFRSGGGNGGASWTDRFSTGSSFRRSSVRSSSDATQPLIVAAYVPDEEERDDDASSSAAPVAVVATKDSWIGFIRRSRRTKAGIAFFVLVIVAMSVGLVVSNHRSGGDDGGNASPDPADNDRPPLEWVQVGSDVDGPPDSKFGSSVSLSDNGKRLAVAGPGYFANNGDDGGQKSIRGRGFVQVYESRKEGGDRTWPPLGSNFSAGIASIFCNESSLIAAEFGERAVVSLSGNGTRLAVGSSFHSPSNSTRNIGRLAVFEYEQKSDAWNRIGQIIEGEQEHEYLGASVRLSSDGNIVAVGSPGYSGNDANENNVGRVQVFELDAAKRWATLGGSIVGRSINELSGGSVSLSTDGFILAIGSVVSKKTVGNGAALRIFEFDDDADDWTRKGNDVTAAPGLHDTGWIASISGDGDVVAASSYYVGGDADSFDRGNRNDLVLRVYQDRGGKWVQHGRDVHRNRKQQVGFKSSYVASLSSDGTALALAVRGHDRNGNDEDNGHVHFYYYSEDKDKWKEKEPKIEGESYLGSQFGADVSVSTDFRFAAIGAPLSRGLGFEHGCARVFEKKVPKRSRGTTWIRR